MPWPFQCSAKWKPCFCMQEAITKWVGNKILRSPKLKYWDRSTWETDLFLEILSSSLCLGFSVYLLCLWTSWQLPVPICWELAPCAQHRLALCPGCWTPAAPPGALLQTEVRALQSTALQDCTLSITHQCCEGRKNTFRIPKPLLSRHLKNCKMYQFYHTSLLHIYGGNTEILSWIIF